ncbi:TonB-linked outer membrane protein, SusC/RagA family [Flavobacterium flevense]|nr:TonB-dependent receptor [Flavobacterium flevense]SHM20504.1 TonB-linked outer membrane protein, SusC/RagA family [Flavobacterium flevense]
MKKLFNSRIKLFKILSFHLQNKLNLLFLFTALFSMQARENYAQNTKVTLHLKNVSILQFINRIEETTDYRFVYKTSDVDLERLVTIEANGENISNVLGVVFKNSATTFNFSNKLIYLLKRKTTGIKLNNKSIQEVAKDPVVQDLIARGTVRDHLGMPLPGASIVEKGTTNGTTTDMDGKFRLTLMTKNAVLSISYLGYKNQEYTLTQDLDLNIILQEELQALDEVIAIGYGRAKKKDITGSISTVEGETLVKRNTTQLSQSLQGTLPGVMVTRTNTEPGASGTIRLRGITTIGVSDPLIIVDGVPVNNIDDVNAADVKNISVLKDAASASIYGARAAAGVILITTKRAGVEKESLVYSMTSGVEVPTAFPKTVGAQRYLEMINEFTWNDAGNTAGGEYALYSKDQVENWINNSTTDPNNYPVTDWKNLILNDYAFKSNHNLSFSAGSDHLKSRASINYENVDALYDHKNYKRFMGRVNNSFVISDKINAQVDFSYSNENTASPSVNPIQSLQRYPSIFAAMWSDGRIAEGQNGNNIYARLHYGGKENIWRQKINARISLDYNLLTNLKVTGVFAPYFYHTKGKSFTKKINYYAAEDPTVFAGTISGADATNLYETRNDGRTLTNQLLVNYNGKITNHNFDILAGYEGYSTFYESLMAQGLNYTLSNFPYLDLAPLDYMSNSGNAVETAYRSYFGRMLYDYKGKYLVQANIRYDGSSRFHPDFRWGAFPSASVGWIITKEAFMPTDSALSFLKLKASFGKLGNERIGNYPYQSSIGFSNTLLYQGDKVVSAITAAQYAYAIRDISWETTSTINVGLESYFFKNRMMFNFDYYKKTTKDMLLELEIPDYLGYENPNQNTGKMHTTGWDAELSWRDKVGHFSYSISANLSDFKSRMGNLGGIVFSGEKITREGTEFNEWYGYVSDGLFQNSETIANAATLYKTVKPGDIKYKDISGPEGVPDGIISPDYDRVPLGGSQPRLLYGGEITAGYKGFDLTLGFQGVGKQNSRLTTQMVKPFFSAWTNPPAIIDGEYWSVYNSPEENLNAKFPRLSYASAENNNYEMSDYWLIKGGYFRLKNIVLGYDLPEKACNAIGISGIRVFATATDLFSINNYPKGWDPEVADNSYISSSLLLGASVKF